MAEDNSNIVENTDDLDAFSAELFGTTESEDTEEVETIDEDEDDSELDGHDEDDTLATDEEDEDEEEEDLQPKSKKNSYQERINELTARAREAERREIATLARLEKLEASREEKNEKPPLRDILPDGAPNPDALNEDGEALYPLGEFDPKYITALVKHASQQELASVKAEETKRQEAEAIQAIQDELTTNWETKLVEAENEIPEIRENIRNLTEVFEDIDPAYGEYLAMTVMVSDVGHLVLNYLSQNTDEAQQIVAAGPAAATRALGRLEAQFMKNEAKSESKSNKRVSDAPVPPENKTRGHGGRFAVSPDTDDLDAFEREYFGKK